MICVALFQLFKQQIHRRLKVLIILPALTGIKALLILPIFLPTVCTVRPSLVLVFAVASIWLRMRVSGAVTWSVRRIITSITLTVTPPLPILSSIQLHVRRKRGL